jgi:isoquinoline 1-oxidoreductase alpha subunit
MILIRAARRSASGAQGGQDIMVKLNVNGVGQEFDGDPNTPLLWFVRDQLGLFGTKYGCGAGLCGACTVHLDGEAVRSCLTTIGDAQGKQVVTIEGLSPDGNHPVQVAWREINVPQCGFCQTGQIMQASGLLAANKAPSDAEILEAMAGNICRCGCYERIVAAVRQAATGA